MYCLLMTLGQERYPRHPLCAACKGSTHPPELLVFQGQDASALGEKLYFNSWQRMRGGEVALGAPAVERMSDSVCTLAMGRSWLI